VKTSMAGDGRLF